MTLIFFWLQWLESCREKLLKTDNSRNWLSLIFLFFCCEMLSAFLWLYIEDSRKNTYHLREKFLNLQHLIYSRGFFLDVFTEQFYWACCGLMIYFIYRKWTKSILCCSGEAVYPGKSHSIIDRIVGCYGFLWLLSQKGCVNKSPCWQQGAGQSIDTAWEQHCGHLREDISLRSTWGLRINVSTESYYSYYYYFCKYSYFTVHFNVKTDTP